MNTGRSYRTEKSVELASMLLLLSDSCNFQFRESLYSIFKMLSRSNGGAAESLGQKIGCSGRGALSSPPTNCLLGTSQNGNSPAQVSQYVSPNGEFWGRRKVLVASSVVRVEHTEKEGLWRAL
jgi:hypothetical protein